MIIPRAPHLLLFAGILDYASIFVTGTDSTPLKVVPETDRSVEVFTRRNLLLNKCKKKNKNCSVDDDCCAELTCSSSGKCEGDIRKFKITLEFLGTGVTPEYEAIWASAVARWEEIIKFVPCYSEGDESLYIEVTLEPIDGEGGTLGFAGWDSAYICDNGLLPFYGGMTFDSEDLVVRTDSEIEDIVVHEIGHIVGIGTIWDYAFLNDIFDISLEGPGCTACDYLGYSHPDADLLYKEGCPNARKQYKKLSGSKVPKNPEMIEVDGGSGTRCGHWDEVTFGNELMTGYLNSAPEVNPFSKITVGALADLGYIVKPGAADYYVVPSIMASEERRAKSVIDLTNDIKTGHVQTIMLLDGTVVGKFVDGVRIED